MYVGMPKDTRDQQDSTYVSLHSLASGSDPDAPCCVEPSWSLGYARARLSPLHSCQRRVIPHYSRNDGHRSLISRNPPYLQYDFNV